MPSSSKPEWNSRLNQLLIENGIVGSKLKFQLMQFATIPELDKYSRYMNNVEKAATILLRLTKNVEENATEKPPQQLANHRKLARQIQVAEKVQNSLDKTHEEVSEMMLKYFGGDGLEKFNDYLKEKLRLSLMEWQFRNDIKSIDICLTESCDIPM